jgi:hypothetical protein
LSNWSALHPLRCAARAQSISDMVQTLTGVASCKGERHRICIDQIGPIASGARWLPFHGRSDCRTGADT